MAAPQTHLSLVLIPTIILTAMGFQLTFVEFAVLIFWSFLFDFIDHLIDPDPKIIWLSIRDMGRRAIYGGPTSKELENQEGWLHCFPGMIAVSFFAFTMFRWGYHLWWIPIAGWVLHRGVDQLQRATKEMPCRSIFFPLRTGKFTRWGYPIKCKHEFTLTAAVSFGLCYYLSVTPTEVHIFFAMVFSGWVWVLLDSFASVKGSNLVSQALSFLALILFTANYFV